MIEYFVFLKEDVDIFYKNLINLIKTILADNIPQKYSKSLPEEYVSKMADFIEDGSAFIVGAKDKGSLIGFSWAYALDVFDERRFHINMICVDLLYRKKGIARRLLEIQINEAKRRGVKAIEAMTTRNNENSYNWFHSAGFEDERVKVKLELKYDREKSNGSQKI